MAVRSFGSAVEGGGVVMYMFTTKENPYVIWRVSLSCILIFDPLTKVCPAYGRGCWYA